LPKPPYFQQAYPFSCVPACLKMVLADLGYEISETELRNLSDCDETGTSPSKAVKAAIECGFNAYQASLTFEELAELIAHDIMSIVFIRISAEANYSHAIVVYKITSTKVFAIDPTEIGERKIDINEFTEIWSRGLTIIIER
jgi:ABC-type bacteriocin/lantibiotic exporter with double-glycine peptidase domain